MSTEAVAICIRGLEVQIVRKDIKNLHLGVYPPHGRVRVAAPLVVSDDAVRLAVIDKLGWIKRQQTRFAAQSRQSRREMVSGESHYFLGRRYRLRVVAHQGAGKVGLRARSFLELRVRPDTDAEGRERVLLQWYREQLRTRIPPLLAKWEPILGVHASDWRIKRMKTRWGACSTEAHRIWLNLELAKKPVRCLEYIVVHELVHLIEHHNDRFIELMDRHLPPWRQRRRELDAAPLAHSDWAY
ncbi:MAG: M48 family metallopeptidase [Planctomycetes bacterium]|nr:M48 family metallopeptidase [Planctomycetota bacterium]